VLADNAVIVESAANPKRRSVYWISSSALFTALDYAIAKKNADLMCGTLEIFEICSTLLVRIFFMSM
jgi:hypothetical protein